MKKLKNIINQAKNLVGKHTEWFANPKGAIILENYLDSEQSAESTALASLSISMLIHMQAVALCQFQSNYEMKEIFCHGFCGCVHGEVVILKYTLPEAKEGRKSHTVRKNVNPKHIQRGSTL